MATFIFIALCGMLITAVSGQATEGTTFVVALPRTGGDFDGLITMTARENTDYTIESASDTRSGTIPAGGSYTETYPMEQRVTFGDERKGLIITASNPIAVHIDQPSWELDAALARPMVDSDTEFYVVSYLGDRTTASFEPLSFYYVVIQEDLTTVLIHEDDGEIQMVLNKFDVFTRDSNNPLDADLDFTGVHVTADKPVAVYAGHGRVLFPDNDNYQYIFSSMPNTAEINTAYTTVPIRFGPEDTGYMVRAVAASDNTLVEIPTLDVSETINAGEFYQLEHRESLSSFKVYCTPACYVAEFPIATLVQGGALDTTMSGAMVPLVADVDFSDQSLLCTLPFYNERDNVYATLAIVAEDYPVNDVYVDGENVDGWVDISTHAVVMVEVDPWRTSPISITSTGGERIAAYLYNNIHTSPGGTKAYTCGVN